MGGDKISRVAAMGTGTIGASWTAVFLARADRGGERPGTRRRNLSASICRRGLAKPRATVATTCRTALGGAELSHRA
jgi:hypothetical protein